MKTFDTIAGALLAFYLPLTVCAPFAATYVVTLLFSERYHDAGAVVPVLVAAALCYGLAHLGRMGAIALGNRRRVVTVAAVVLFVNLALNAYAIPQHGYTGAAWTTLITEILEVLLLVGLFLRGQALSRILRALAIPSLASGVVALLLAVTGFRDLAAILTAALLYPPLLAAAAMFIAPQEARSVAALIRRPRAPIDAPTMETP